MMLSDREGILTQLEWWLRHGLIIRPPPQAPFFFFSFSIFLFDLFFFFSEVWLIMSSSRCLTQHSEAILFTYKRQAAIRCRYFIASDPK